MKAHSKTKKDNDEFPKLSVDERRFEEHLQALERAADELRVFNRIDAHLLAALVEFAAIRVKNNIGDPWWPPIQPTTVRDMKAAIDTVSKVEGCGWWHDLDDNVEANTPVWGQSELG